MAGGRRLDDLKAIESDLRWKTIRYAYDANDNPIYMGVHETNGATGAEDGWRVWKFTWTAGTVSGYICTLREGYISGIWDDRASMDWI